MQVLLQAHSSTFQALQFIASRALLLVHLVPVMSVVDVKKVTYRDALAFEPVENLLSYVEKLLRVTQSFRLSL